MIAFELKTNKRKRATHPVFSNEQQEGEPAAATSTQAPLLLQDAMSKANTLKNEANILAGAGRFRVALSKLNEAIELTPENAILWELKAQVLMQLDEHFAAVCAAEQAVKLSPQWIDALLTLGRAQTNFGELDLAMETLKRACSITDVDENTRAEVIEDFEHVRTLLQQRDALRESGYEVIRGQAIPRAELEKLHATRCSKHSSK